MSDTIHNEYLVPRPGPRDPAIAAPSPARRSTMAGLARGLSSAMLATVLSVLIVVADRLVDAWSQGSLALAVLVLWLVVFVGLALFARATAYLALNISRGVYAWSERTANEHADRELMHLSRHDPRAIDDVDAALARTETDGLTRRYSVPIFYRPW